MKYELTNNEANTLKDILLVIGKDTVLTRRLAASAGLTVRTFNRLTDRAFQKLGNGRVTVMESGTGPLAMIASILTEADQKRLVADAK